MEGIECTLTEFVDDSELDGSVCLLEKALQRDLGGLDRGAKADSTRSKEMRCRPLHLGPNSPTQRYRLGEGWLESCPAEKDQGCWPVWASSVPRWPRRPTASRLVSGIVWPGLGKGSSPVLGTGEAAPRILHLVSGPSLEERH